MSFDEMAIIALGAVAVFAAALTIGIVTGIQVERRRVDRLLGQILPAPEMITSPPGELGCNCQEKFDLFGPDGICDWCPKRDYYIGDLDEMTKRHDNLKELYERQQAEMHPDAPDDIRLTRFGALNGCAWIFFPTVLAIVGIAIWKVLA